MSNYFNRKICKNPVSLIILFPAEKIVCFFLQFSRYLNFSLFTVRLQNEMSFIFMSIIFFSILLLSFYVHYLFSSPSLSKMTIVTENQVFRIKVGIKLQYLKCWEKISKIIFIFVSYQVLQFQVLIESKKTFFIH